MNSPLEIVVSHSCAGKKAKGRGTEKIQNQAVEDLGARQLNDGRENADEYR